MTLHKYGYGEMTIEELEKVYEDLQLEYTQQKTRAEIAERALMSECWWDDYNDCPRTRKEQKDLFDYLLENTRAEIGGTKS